MSKSNSTPHWLSINADMFEIDPDVRKKPASLLDRLAHLEALLEEERAARERQLRHERARRKKLEDQLNALIHILASK